MKSARLGLLGTVAVATTLLTGCADDGASPTLASAPASRTATSSTSPSIEPSEPASSSTTATTIATTVPGSALALGEKAVVNFKTGTNEGILGITVTAIEKGVHEDLAPLQLGEKANGQVPYYIRATVSNEGGDDMSFTPAPGLSGLLPDGTGAGRVSIIGDFEKCPNTSAPKDFNSKGTSYETCELAVAPEATSVASAAFDEGDQYQGAALTWKA